MVCILLPNKGIEKVEFVKEKPVIKPSLSEIKQEEIIQRMHTIVVFGIPSQMNKLTLEHK